MRPRSAYNQILSAVQCLEKVLDSETKALESLTKRQHTTLYNMVTELQNLEGALYRNKESGA